MGRVLLAASRDTVPPPPALSEYAVLGLQRVTLRPRARVEGGSVGALGDVLTLGADVRVAGAVAADTIRLGAGADANRFFCRFVTARPFGRVVGGPVTGGGPLPACRAFTPPLVAPTALPAPAVVPGTSALRVPRRTGTAPLPAASYGDVRVGTGALLQLAGGEYAVRSIRIAPGGRVVCTAPCHVGVAERVVLGANGELGAANGVRVDMVRIDVATNGGRAFVAQPTAAVAGTIYAPGGTVVLKRGGTHRGAFVGRIVTVGPRVTVRTASAL
jgi:hypothetical protein